MKKNEKELPKGVRQRKDGRYEFRKMINGSSISVVKPTLKEVLEEKKRILAKLEYGEAYCKKSNKTLDDFFNEWFAKCKEPYLKQSSINTAKGKYAHSFGSTVGNVMLHNLDSNKIQDAVNELIKRGKSAQNINESFARLNDCLSYAVSTREISINPCLSVVLPKVEKKTVGKDFLTTEELPEFLMTVDSSYYKAFIRIMLFHGLRVGECSALFWKDIDFKNKTININKTLVSSYYEGKKTQELSTPKTFNSYRKVPFMNDAEELFYQMKERKEKLKSELGSRWREPDGWDLVFTTSMGSPCSRYIIEKEFKDIERQINYLREKDACGGGYEPIHLHPHITRHTFASIAFEKGISPVIISKLLGHSSINVTLDIYTSISEELIKRKIRSSNIDFMGASPQTFPEETVYSELNKMVATFGANKNTLL